MAEAVTAALFANIVTIGFLYACWNLNRNGPNLPAVFIGLFSLGWGLLAVLASG